MLVFVYGTLKQGKINHSKIGHCTFLKEMTLPVKGFLYWSPTRNYPHFVQDDMGDFISGELYEVSDKDVDSLDYFEGHPSFFKRKGVVVDDDVIFYYEYVNHLTDSFEDLNKHLVKISKY